MQAPLSPPSPITSHAWQINPLPLMTHWLSHRSSTGLSPKHTMTHTGSGASELSSVSRLSHLTSSSEIQPPVHSSWSRKGKQWADPPKRSKRTRFALDDEGDPSNTPITVTKKRQTRKSEGRIQKSYTSVYPVHWVALRASLELPVS